MITPLDRLYNGPQHELLVGPEEYWLPLGGHHWSGCPEGGPDPLVLVDRTLLQGGPAVGEGGVVQHILSLNTTTLVDSTIKQLI